MPVAPTCPHTGHPFAQNLPVVSRLTENHSQAYKALHALPSSWASISFPVALFLANSTYPHLPILLFLQHVSTLLLLGLRTFCSPCCLEHSFSGYRRDSLCEEFSSEATSSGTASLNNHPVGDSGFLSPSKHALLICGESFQLIVSNAACRDSNLIFCYLHTLGEKEVEGITQYYLQCMLLG